MDNFINICGVKYSIEECEDTFTNDATHFGEISYTNAKIKINKNMPEDLKWQTLCHEWLHGALVLNAFEAESNDEKLISALSIAIAQTFKLK